MTRQNPLHTVVEYTAPTYSMTGELLDGGIDLKMAGTCEYMQDLVYLVSLAQLLSLVSSYAWCAMLCVAHTHALPLCCIIAHRMILLVVPAFACYSLYTNVVHPWLSAPPVQEVEETEDMRKRREKLERKMAKQQNRVYRR